MRNVISLNDGWRFVHRSDCDPACMPADGTTVALPHTWNAVDGHDGHDILINKAKDWSEGDLFGGNAEHYDRGAYWYYRQFETPCQPLADGRVYVEIPAAGMQATVYVNGQKAGYHEGGFSLFRFDVTDLCAPKDNLLAICVSNEYRTNIYPQHADFTFYGGLYRGVNLISVPEAHFDLMYYGGPGIVVIPMDEDGTAVFDLQSFPKGTDEHHTVFYEIRDAQGTEVASATRPASSPDVALPVADVKRWSPTDPYLYTVRACLLRRNEVVDEVRVRTGFRTFKVWPE